jgi:hypothetical protein
VPTRLPPETLDEILEYIPIDGEGIPTLIACALVATWWTGPSQRRLFSSVSIDDKNYWRWMNGIVLSRSKTYLCRYVRSFKHSLPPEHPMRNLLKNSRGGLSALYSVHSLALSGLLTEPIGGGAVQACFSAFRETLTDLYLGESCAMSFSTFVTVVGYFPNLTSLQLGFLELKPDEAPVPHCPDRFGGRYAFITAPSVPCSSSIG